MKILCQLRTGVTLYRTIKKFVLTILQSSTKHFFDSGIVLASDLLFNLNSTESFNIIKTRVVKTNFLTWAGLRHAVSHEFKYNMIPLNSSPSCVINNNVFDITKKKSKRYYSLLINKKAQFHSAFSKLQGEFHFFIDSFQKVFMLPHNVTLEPILYTNTKLYKNWLQYL